MKEIAALIDGVLSAVGKPEEATVLAATKQKVIALTGRFPLPYKL
jgi:glycine hydroxymethyltransferase